MAPSTVYPFEPLVKEANAEGITWVASSGDSGAAARDWGPSRVYTEFP
jgi:subtilase family serine protease